MKVTVKVKTQKVTGTNADMSLFKLYFQDFVREIISSSGCFKILQTYNSLSYVKQGINLVLANYNFYL